MRAHQRLQFAHGAVSSAVSDAMVALRFDGKNHPGVPAGQSLALVSEGEARGEIEQKKDKDEQTASQPLSRMKDTEQKDEKIGTSDKDVTR